MDLIFTTSDKKLDKCITNEVIINHDLSIFVSLVNIMYNRNDIENVIYITKGDKSNHAILKVYELFKEINFYCYNLTHDIDKVNNNQDYSFYELHSDDIEIKDNCLLVCHDLTMEEQYYYVTKLNSKLNHIDFYCDNLEFEYLDGILYKRCWNNDNKHFLVFDHINIIKYDGIQMNKIFNYYNCSVKNSFNYRYDDNTDIETYISTQYLSLDYLIDNFDIELYPTKTNVTEYIKTIGYVPKEYMNKNNVKQFHYYQTTKSEEYDQQDFLELVNHKIKDEMINYINIIIKRKKDLIYKEKYNKYYNILDNCSILKFVKYTIDYKYQDRLFSLLKENPNNPIINTFLNKCIRLLS